MPKKILTVTLNPAIDETIIYKSQSDYIANKPFKTIFSAGGKGINVSRVLRNLKVHSLNVGLVGGKRGKTLIKLMNQEGLKHAMCYISGETRINQTHLLSNGKLIKRDITCGEKISRKEMNQFFRRYRSLLKQSCLVVLSGRKPQGADDNIYARLIKIAHKEKKEVLLDTSGRSLKKSLSAPPEIIKPNLKEFEQLFTSKARTQKERLHKIKLLHRRGIKVVLLTLGQKGCMASNGKECWLVKPKNIRIQNEVGSGDAFAGGYIRSYLKGCDFKTSVAYAAATATGNALEHKPGRVTKKSIEKVLKSLSMRAL